MPAKMPVRKKPKKGPLAKNLVQIGVRLEHQLNVALYKEAARRARHRYSLQPNKSEIVAEALKLHPDLRKHLKG